MYLNDSTVYINYLSKYVILISRYKEHIMNNNNEHNPQNITEIPQPIINSLIEKQKLLLITALPP